jgi:hypothetical protein
MIRKKTVSPNSQQSQHAGMSAAAQRNYQGVRQVKRHHPVKSGRGSSRQLKIGGGRGNGR